MKKNTALFLALLAVVSLCLVQPAAAAGRGLTMVVVPARYSVMQVGFDLVQRFPVVLVSYQGDATTESPLIHAWNGEEWVKVSLEDYSSANFLQVTPGKAILVGDDALLPPVMAESTAAWCPNVERIPDIDTAALVNSLSKALSFKSADWQWFAARYNLDLQDTNAERRKASWYDRPYYEDQWTPPERRHGTMPIEPVMEQTVEDVPVVEPQEAAPVESQEVAPEPAAEPATGMMPVEESRPAPSEAAPGPWEEKAVATEPPVK